MMHKLIIGTIILAGLGTGALAQGRGTAAASSANKNAPAPPPAGQESPHIMWKKTYWRRIDLREKMNKPFFAREKEITRWIIDAVRAYKLTPYTDDKLAKAMTVEDFNKNLKVPNQTRQNQLSDTEKSMGFTEENVEKQEDEWGDWGDTPGPKKKSTGGQTKQQTEQRKTDQGWGDDASKAPAEGDEFFPNEISVLELKEDVFFDRKAAKLTFDIQTLSLVIPADRFESQIDRQVATFKFSEVMKALDQYPDAIWFNVRNNVQHRRVSEAFALRLFNSRIIKISNPDDQYLDTIYGNDEASLRAAQEEEYKLVEFENGLWEY